MAALAKIKPFDPQSESWDTILSRFQNYLIANAYTDLSGARKRAHFLGLCSTEMYDIACALFAPISIHEVPWDDFQKTLRDHYAPPPSRCARRYAFYHRNQQEGEGINQFVAALRHLALHCEFADLEDYLLDRLVYGVKDIKLRRRLLALPKLDFKTALAEARAAELSAQSLAEMTPGVHQISETCTGDLTPTPTGDEDVLARQEEVCRLIDARPKERRPFRPAHQPPTPCRGCGGLHFRAQCPFKDAICRRCERQGHLARVCSSRRPPPQSASAPRDPPTISFRTPSAAQTGRRFSCNSIYCTTDAASFSINNITPPSPHKITIAVRLGSRLCSMEIDTGSAFSLISRQTLYKHFPSKVPLDVRQCSVTLKDYQGRGIPIVGQGMFPVEYKSFKGKLPLIIVDAPVTSLLGLNWFHALGISISGINCIQATSHAQVLAAEFPTVFNEELGCYTGSKISFSLNPAIAPIRLKPRRIPLPLRSKVDSELDRLIEQGVLEPIDQSPWETPIVTVIKPDGSVRICGDYKCTVNLAMAPQAYPVPVVQHLLHSLGEGSIFAKLDLSQAYQQLPVDSKAADAQAITTHRGVFRCNRLQFGINAAPGIFQGLMERLLYNLPGVVPYFDDVIVTATSETQLMDRVRAVLSKFREVGLRIKPHKCVFAVPKVEFLGFQIDAAGIHPTPDKTKAIREAPSPQSKQELQAFLGLLNFYSVFIPHKATVAEPLHRLLDKGAPWKWGKEQEIAFHSVKQLLTSQAVLAQYAPHLPLVLTCDASPYGIGAVLSHRLQDGKEVPISYFSKTLTRPQRNYGQIDREALALVAGVKRFHHYLYGRAFTLITDHQPLLSLLAGDRPSPQYLSPRMTRWAVFLANYSYTLQYKPGKHIGHADALSRCPLPEMLEDPTPTSYVLAIEDSLVPLTAAEIAKAIHHDYNLSTVYNWIAKGWPSQNVAEQFKPFFSRKTELSIMKGCILWGHRVVIPAKLQPRVLESLHRGHPGVVRMKGVARGIVWWPKIDAQIEESVATCVTCQVNRPAPPSAPPIEWKCPDRPWSRLHMDLAGPMEGQMLLIVVDAFSKWLEVCLLNSTTATAIISCLETLFATHGLPDVIVSDNGPQFVSASFQAFLASLGIKQGLIAPWHPASNGQAERMVRTTKEALAKLSRGSWKQRITEFLFTQHTTPNAVSQKTPAELLMGRRLRTTLDRLHPLYATADWQETTHKGFITGDRVYARNYSGSQRWVPGTIMQAKGPRSYQVRVAENTFWQRHIDQLRPRKGSDISSPGERSQELDSGEDDDEEVWGHIPLIEVRDDTSREEAVVQEGSPGQGGVSLRRTDRVRRKPAYLQEYACLD